MFAVVGYHQHNVIWGKNPVEGVLHETHGNLMYFCGFAEVDDGVDAVAPVALPVAVGVGGVAAELTVDKGVAAATAVDVFVGGVGCIEGDVGTHADVGEEVLLGDDAFAEFIIGNGFDGGGAFEREGGGVEGGGGGGLGAVEGVVDGAVVVEGAERDEGEGWV